ncbi:DNA fragmentation factor subunit beta [Osmerus eperlanus]|uniref:DNA fragmentation factor subunit beta n=1 Tax=Osmerus eperlanus TaxID=29151 RepID=UPI002E106671
MELESMCSKQLVRNKLVKLRSLNGTKKYGLAASNLKVLLKKGCQFLQVHSEGSHICLYEDGTVLTEHYFQTLPDNVELVLLAKEETWNGFVCDIGRLLDTDMHSDHVIEEARKLLSDEQSPKRRKLLGDLLLHLKDCSEAESRKEDGEWFHGIDVRFKTKSSYMKYNCESRIRGYMKEVNGYAKNIEKPKVRAEYIKTAACLVSKLKSDKYHGWYFDRTENDCLCTSEGWFTCQGAFDKEECKSLHSINPYGNRESRIMFSTWNLDHRIEKKRTVIPALVEALQNHKSSDINLDYFYKLLFTTDNLKLVHIVCHKKGTHDLVCDKRKMYQQRKKH